MITERVDLSDKVFDCIKKVGLIHARADFGQIWIETPQHDSVATFSMNSGDLYVYGKKYRDIAYKLAETISQSTIKNVQIIMKEETSFFEKHFYHKTRRIFLWRHWLGDHFSDFYCETCHEIFSKIKVGMDG